MLDDGIPVGSEVICTYNENTVSFEFRGIYRDRHPISGYGDSVYAIEVILGSGHLYEDNLHDCGGLIAPGLGWNLFRGDKMRPIVFDYDPLQNGDTDEDV